MDLFLEDSLRNARMLPRRHCERSDAIQNFITAGHSGIREAQTRNLEIPGSMLRIAPE
jgi:hypothetical protein